MLSPIISLLSKLVSNSACFCDHATNFGLMLDHDVVDMHAKFHSRIMNSDERRNHNTTGGNLQYHAFSHYFNALKK